MLQDILDSNYKSSLLAFLLMSPPRSFTVKELRMKLRIPEPALLTVLRNFEQLSIVSSFNKGKQKFYIVNQKHKLLPEITASLVKNQKSYEDELFHEISKLGTMKGAFLSGVFTGQPQLPVDILLVGSISLSKLEKFLQAAKKRMGIELNYSIMTPDEFILRRGTFDRFLRDIFDYRHIVVIDGFKNKKKA